MPEADDDFLALHPCTDIGFGIVCTAVARNDVHRHFVGAAVLRPAQCADTASDAAVHIAAGAGNHARRERGRVEFVLGVQDQRLVQRIGMQRARRRAVQQRQEMRGHAGAVTGSTIVGLDIDAAAVAGEMPPVQQHRAETGDQAVGDIARLAGRMAVALRKHRAQHRTSGAHHVHRMRIRRHQFQRFLHDRRQAAQTFELGAIGLEL